MRHALILVSLVACTADPPMDSGPAVTSQIAQHDYIEHRRPKLDVLLVVDNTSGMAPYQNKLPQLSADLSAAISSLAHGLTNVHVAMTTDGALSPVLSDEVDWFGAHTSSFAGSLQDQLTTLVEVGASAPGPAQPLAVMVSALTSPSGAAFVREDADLAIVTITASDDASPVANYVAAVKALKADPAGIAVFGINPEPSARLDRFYAAFANRNGVISIEADDYAPAFAVLGQLPRTTLEGQCLAPPADVDPQTPGDQFDCLATAWDHGAELGLVPVCEGDADPTTGSCWLPLRSSACLYGDLEFHLRGLWSWYLHPRIHLECVVK